MTEFEAISTHTRPIVWQRSAASAAALVVRIVTALKDRRDAAQLYRLSDADLKDIGVTRNDVDREVMKPVTWR